MNIDVKCFSTLVNGDNCSFKESTTYKLEEGQTVEDLIARVGVDRKKVQVAFVNNRRVELGTTLSDGDRVGLTPATGGM